MKTYLKIFTAILVFFLATMVRPEKSNAQGAEVSFQVFYDQLSPFGQWINYPGYGYVWIPDAGPDFSPYSTNGYWAYTEDGWTWVSDYDWGWAPFHYGRWDYSSPYGWFWVPDYTWGPAWVAWRHGGGYYGWAPLSPGIEIDIVIGGRFNPPARRWCFMGEGYMGTRDYRGHFESREHNDRFIRDAGFINYSHEDRDRHVKYMSGPRREEVQKFSGRKVEEFHVSDRDRPGHSVSGNQINIYRPRIQAGSGNNARPGRPDDHKNQPNNRQPQQPQRQEPQRQQPQQQPQRQEPQRQQPQRQQPQQQPQRQEPQRQQPQQQPQRQEPQRQQPQQQPQRQEPQQPRYQPQPRPQMQQHPMQQQPQPRPQQQPQRQQPQPQQQPRPQPQQQPRPQLQPQQQQRNAPQQHQELRQPGR